MDAPAAPTPPDPVATAAAQQHYNSQAARQTTQLNRANQITPYGSLTWSHGDPAPAPTPLSPNTAVAPPSSPTAPATPVGSWQNMIPDPQGTGGYVPEQTFTTQGESASTAAPAAAPSSGYDPQDTWTSTVTLDPRVQALVDSGLATSQKLTGVTGTAADRVAEVLSKPIDYGAMPAAGSAAGAYSAAQGLMPDMKGDIAAQRELLGQGTAMAGQALGNFQNAMGQDVYAGVADLPTADAATRQKVEDALYSRLTSRLNPEFSSAENLTRSTLMNRGIAENSDAWRRELDNFNRGKNDAYSTARWDSIVKGGDEMQRLFDMQMGLRKQTVGENQWERDMFGREASNAAGIQSGLTRDLQGLIGTNTNNQVAASNIASQQFANQNTQRSMALTEAERARANVLNELASLRSGTQVDLPQFGGTPSGASVIPAPFTQLAQGQYNGQIQQYNADIGSNNATLAALANLGGSALPLLL